MQTSLTLNDGRAIPQLGLGVWQTPADTTAIAVQAALAAGYGDHYLWNVAGPERRISQTLRQGSSTSTQHSPMTASGRELHFGQPPESSRWLVCSC